VQQQQIEKLKEKGERYEIECQDGQVLTGLFLGWFLENPDEFGPEEILEYEIVRVEKL
jgi:hypothetical protein